jgi:hypothetical protein
MNGRHFMLSSAFLIQSYKQISPDVRGNLSGLVVFNLSTRELESIIYEHNYLESSKAFMKMFRQTTKKKHSNFIINYSNDPESLSHLLLLIRASTNITFAIQYQILPPSTEAGSMSANCSTTSFFCK